MQLEITLYPDEIAAEEKIDTAVLFAPNGHRRCEACRKRLHAFGGRLLCVNAYCPGVTR